MMTHVELSPLRAEDRPTLARLLQLYHHDFSELVGALPRDDGSFDAGQLESFGAAAGQHAFLIRCPAGLAGFALLARGSRVSGDAAVMDVAEFFVVRGVRRQGVAQSAARALFARFPGKWEVRVLLANERALAFWQSCIGGFARFDTSSWTAPSGRQFTVLRFESSASSGAGAKVAEPLAFRPVDFARDAALCARFKRDAYVCSFGSDALFVEHFGSDAGYLDSLRARVAVHVWRGREIVGQLDIALSSDPDPQPSYVSLFYLIESERGTDAGDALHAYALERLRQHGAARAELHVSPTNARALRYYLKHGWRDLGPEPSGEVHRMRLALS